VQPKAVVAERGTGLETATDVLEQRRGELRSNESLVGYLALGRIAAESPVNGMGRDKRAVLARGVGPLTRPGIGTGQIYHPSRHGSELDIAVADQQVGTFLDPAGPKTAFPKGTDSPLAVYVRTGPSSDRIEGRKAREYMQNHFKS